MKKVFLNQNCVRFNCFPHYYRNIKEHLWLILASVMQMHSLTTKDILRSLFYFSLSPSIRKLFSQLHREIHIKVIWPNHPHSLHHWFNSSLPISIWKTHSLLSWRQWSYYIVFNFIPLGWLLFGPAHNCLKALPPKGSIRSRQPA